MWSLTLNGYFIDFQYYIKINCPLITFIIKSLFGISYHNMAACMHLLIKLLSLQSNSDVLCVTMQLEDTITPPVTTFVCNSVDSRKLFNQIILR